MSSRGTETFEKDCDQEFSPPNAIVWSEIPVSGTEKAMAFHAAVSDHDMEPDERASRASAT